MTNTSVATRKRRTIVDLATAIEEDIRSRGLQSGDAYQGQAETKRMLGVGTDSANRALQLLAQRGVLVRRQRKGTFVGNVDGTKTECPIRRVHIVLPEELLKMEGYSTDGRILGIQGELPRAEIVVNFLPSNDEGKYVENLVQETSGLRGPRAFVLASSTFLTQQILSGSGLPAVIGGSLYGGVTGLSWVDDDHNQAARLAAEYLLKRKCEQFLILLRQRPLPGERVFLDSLIHELGLSAIGCGEVLIRNTSNAVEEIKATALEALNGARGKLGIVVRTEPIAKVVEDLIVTMGIKVGVDFEMVGANFHSSQHVIPFPYPVLRGMGDPKEQGKSYGVLLKRFVDTGQAGKCLFPVELTLPDWCS